MRNVKGVFIAVLSLILVCSVVIHVLQYLNKQVLGSELLNNGLEQTFVYLNDASDSLAKNRVQDANTFLSWSVGGLLVIRQPLTHYGVSGLTGITLELQKAQGILSDPQGQSERDVQSMKEFVTSTATYFRNCIVNNHVSVQKLKTVIQQIYAVMPSSDQAQIENSGP